jgi:hypothetical protein
MQYYRIYPTLIDQFNNMKTGKYGVQESDFLDIVNRKPRPINEAAEKGKAFHEITSNFDWENEVKSGYVKKGWWAFPEPLVKAISQYRHGGLYEVYCDREIEVPGTGRILLYGYVDTIRDGMVIDLKTTGFYRGLSYLKSMQRLVYLYITQSRLLRFLITDFTYIYWEDYYQQNNIEELLHEPLMEMCAWLEMNRDKITDTKIFG